MTDANEIAVAIRPAQRSDLDAINGVVEAAVMSWPLPAKAKRRALPDLHFHPIDLDQSVLLVVIGSHRHILGVAACDPTHAVHAPAGKRALLLDGLYVHPDHHHHDIARHLLDEARVLARRHGRDGLLVRARRETEALFLGQGMVNLPSGSGTTDDSRHLWQGFA
jgi:GNAT superfamily N-acetyltransferase